MTVAVTEQSDIAPLMIIKSDIAKPVGGTDYSISNVVSNYSDKSIEIYAVGAIFDDIGKLSNPKLKKTIIQPMKPKKSLLNLKV